MKKIIVFLSIITICAMHASAQNESKKFSVGFGIEGGLPTGYVADTYNYAVGLTIRFSYHLGPGFATLTSGVIGYGPKSVDGEPKKVGLQIPIRAGYKYIIQHHFFLMGEVGYSSFKSYYGYQGDLISNTQGSLTVAPSIGVQFNAFEVSLRYGANLSNGGGGVAAVRLGFNF